jgi:hypothetical protein
MKNKFLVLVTLVTLSFSAMSQSVISKGDKMLNAGLGIPYFDGFIPSLHLSGEYAAIPTGDIGIVSFGGEVEYKYSVYKTSYLFGKDYTYSYHSFFIGARAAWHLTYFDNSKWDVYAGLSAGLYMYSTYETYNIAEEEFEREGHVSPSIGEFVGGRMMINENMGLFAEVGYASISFARIGLTFKL